MATMFFPKSKRFPPQGNKKPEADFKKAGREWLKVRFGRHIFQLAIAGGPYQRAGSPDDVYSIRGQFVAIEWKAPDGSGRVGKKQQELIDEIRAAGGRAGAIASWKELEALVDGIEPVQLGLRAR